MKLMVMGYKEHGKDTVCEILRDLYGFSFMNSSLISSEEVIFPILSPLYGYKDCMECFNDRMNHRKEWFDLIAKYNKDSETKLAEKIYSEVDIYCGIRRYEEFEAIKNKGLFDYAIWVDARKRKPPEDYSSCTISPIDADFILDNNGSKIDLKNRVTLALKTLYLRFFDEIENGKPTLNNTIIKI